MVTEYLYTILYILYRCLSDLWSTLQPRRVGVSVWHQRGAPQTTQGWCVGSEDVQEMPPVGQGPVNTSTKSEACLCHAFCPVTQQCDWRQVCLAWGGALPGRNPLRRARVCMLSHSIPLRLFGTVAPPPPPTKALLSMGFIRQEYWSGLPCSPLGDLPDPGIKASSSVSPALQVDSQILYHLSHQGSPDLPLPSLNVRRHGEGVSLLRRGTCHSRSPPSSVPQHLRECSQGRQ